MPWVPVKMHDFKKPYNQHPDSFSVAMFTTSHIWRCSIFLFRYVQQPLVARGQIWSTLFSPIVSEQSAAINNLGQMADPTLLLLPVNCLSQTPVSTNPTLNNAGDTAKSVILDLRSVYGSVWNVLNNSHPICWCGEVVSYIGGTQPWCWLH